jgi:hypothetical protein
MSTIGGRVGPGLRAIHSEWAALAPSGASAPPSPWVEKGAHPCCYFGEQTSASRWHGEGSAGSEPLDHRSIGDVGNHAVLLIEGRVPERRQHQPMNAFRVKHHSTVQMLTPNFLGPEAETSKQVSVLWPQDPLGHMVDVQAMILSARRFECLTCDDPQRERRSSAVSPDEVRCLQNASGTLELGPAVWRKADITIPEIMNVVRQPLLVIAGTDPVESEIRPGNCTKRHGGALPRPRLPPLSVVRSAGTL